MVHDFHRTLYLSGLGPTPGNLETSASDLKKYLNEQGFTKIHTMGFSGGGIGALLYAEVFSAETCLVFSPPSYVPASDNTADNRGLLLRRKIEKLNLLGSSDVLSRYALSNVHPKTHVYYPYCNKIDVHHAERLRQFDHVTMFPQESSVHTFWLGWDLDDWSQAFDRLLVG